MNGGSSSVTISRPRPLADRDRELAVLHRRVERLLERAVQAMDLVDEEDGARLERGQQRGDVALSLERRAGGLHERRAELGGDDLRERGLAEPGGPGQQDVVERLAARRGSLERDARAARAPTPGRRTPRAGAAGASARGRPHPAALPACGCAARRSSAGRAAGRSG